MPARVAIGQERKLWGRQYATVTVPGDGESKSEEGGGGSDVGVRSGGAKVILDRTRAAVAAEEDENLHRARDSSAAEPD